MRDGAGAQSGVELSREGRVESAYLEFAPGPEQRAVNRNEPGEKSGRRETLSKRPTGSERLKPDRAGNDFWA